MSVTTALLLNVGMPSLRAQTVQKVQPHVYRGSPTSTQHCNLRRYSNVQLTTALSDLIHRNLDLGASQQGDVCGNGDIVAATIAGYAITYSTLRRFSRPRRPLRLRRPRWRPTRGSVTRSMRSTART